MKEITKMSRLTGQLEKAFRMLNADFFDNQLPVPVITVAPTRRAYGHYTPWNSWETSEGGAPEINIASATLDRPLDLIIETMVHEMVHCYNDKVLHVNDTSRSGTFHNAHFKAAAESHGLICEKVGNYGYALTTASDELLEWIITHDELREIEICRKDFETSTGNGNRGTGNDTGRGKNPNSHSIKYTCPCCKNSVRATKEVNIACLDCNVPMIPNI